MACLAYKVMHGRERAAHTWESLHFNKAATQFLSMMGGRERFRVLEVRICMNKVLEEKFEMKRKALSERGRPTDEIWVFHGTPRVEVVDKIISGGFKVGGTHDVAIRNGAVYGAGVYTDTGPNTPASYAQTSNRVILALALPGVKGVRRREGVDMWSPAERPDWAIFRDPDALLPQYVVKYEAIQ